MGDTYSSNKGFAADLANNPVKKVHSISNKIFVVIDDVLAKRLDIDGDNTWFEQQESEGGILLRIHRSPSIKED